MKKKTQATLREEARQLLSAEMAGKTSDAGPMPQRVLIALEILRAPQFKGE